MKHIFKVCFWVIILLLTACSAAVEKTDEMETTALDISSAAANTGSSETDGDVVLSMENTLMTIKRFPASPSSSVSMQSFLVVRTDGNVYTVYLDKETAWALEDELYQCNVSAWTLVGNIELLGKLSDDELAQLTEYIAQIDLQSDFYDVYHAEGPLEFADVVVTEYRVAYCYKYNEANELTAFHIKTSHIPQTNTYTTYDENAINALWLLVSSDVYADWTNEFIEAFGLDARYYRVY